MKLSIVMIWNTVIIFEGWGTLEADGEQPDILQEIALPLVGNDVCAEAMQSTGTQV